MEMCDFLYLLIESHYSHVESSLRMRDVCAQKCVYHLDGGKRCYRQKRNLGIPNGFFVFSAISVLN